MAVTTIRSATTDEDALAQATTRHLLGRLDQAIATLEVARRQLIAQTVAPIAAPDYVTAEWSWSCDLCVAGGRTSGHLDDVVAYRHGHMRAVHAVELDR